LYSEWERGEVWQCFPNGITCNLGIPGSENMGSGGKFYYGDVVTVAILAITAAVFY
jgi:hypothetical protein